MNDNLTRAKIPVVIFGCGAVAERFYAPTLRQLERDDAVSVRALVDPAPERTEALRAFFPEAGAYDEPGRLPAGSGELAIVAAPDRFHAPLTLAALESDMSVLVEKPMAHSVADAEAMITSARSANKLLAVGLFRRFFSSSQAMREIVSTGLLGDDLTFEVLVGNKLNWPAKSASFFRKDLAGGGVLMDIGPHVLDLLIWWFGEPAALEYADDAMGGLEQNCRLSIEFAPQAQDAAPVTGEVTMTRDWKLPNTLRVTGTRGWASMRFGRGAQLDLGFHDSEFAFDAHVFTQRVEGNRPALDRPGREQAESFAAQIHNVLGALRGDNDLAVPGEEGIRSLRLIERCYNERHLLEMPWFDSAERAQAIELSEAMTP